MSGGPAPRSPGPCPLDNLLPSQAQMIPPNSQLAVARADVTLGLSTSAFARMIADSPALTSRGLEMLDQREQALGDAIAAEMGSGAPQPRPGYLHQRTRVDPAGQFGPPGMPRGQTLRFADPHRIQLKRPTGSLMSSSRFHTAMARMHGKEPW